MKNVLYTGTPRVMALLFLVTARLTAIDPERLDEVVVHALNEAPGALVVEVGIEEGWDGPIADIEFGDGSEMYVALRESGYVTIGREYDTADGARRRIVERIQAGGADILPITEIYRVVIDSLDGGTHDLEIGSTDLYEIEYEIEYGRLVVEVTFRQENDNRGSSEITLYVDPIDGRILAVEYDD